MNDIKLFLTVLIAFTASCRMVMVANPPGVGPFTAGPGQQIYFAPGNLQYQASSDTWRFAPEQFDIIGNGNVNIGPGYDGWVDVFPWGTGSNPTMITHTISGYDTFTDWGINQIDNYPENTWRTLTDAEIEYIFYGRANASQLWASARVNSILGIVLLPDDWLSKGLGISVSNYYTNSYSLTDWKSMEAAGAVFLPAAGYLETVPNCVMHSVNQLGMYWTSTANPKPYTGEIQNGTSDIYYDITQSDELIFSNSAVNPWYFGFRYRGRSVRLIYNEPDCDSKQVIFKEDFGGDDPADPQISNIPYPNLASSYTQSSTDLGAGKAMITKKGWASPFSAHWYEQSDHNYPGEYTRGYFMEVDGLADNGPVVSYSMRVLPGNSLHCECYVANIDAYNYVTAYAQVALQVIDARNNQQLAYKDSGPLPYSPGYPTSPTTPWHLVSLDFVLPNTTDSIILHILNTATSQDGNDFAIDDISVWECVDIQSIEVSGCDSVEYAFSDGTSRVFFNDTTFLDADYAQVTIQVHKSSYTSRTLHGEEEVVYKGVAYKESTILIERDTTEFGCESVDTVHIEVSSIPEEYLDSLIVNEMNWIICCNNRLLRAHYPADTYDYQWYKNGQPVSSFYMDYGDYYTEDHPLQGEFYLIVKVGRDMGNGVFEYKYVRSNMIVIAAPSLVSVAPNPAVSGDAICITAESAFHYRVVSLSGLCMATGNAEQMVLLPPLPTGVYLVDIQQQDNVSTIKLMIR